MKHTIRVKDGAKVTFNNNVDYCIGTGRMGLALQKAYQEQLGFVQKYIGFKHIRGHGLFTDDMAIYQQYKDAEGNIHDEYNYTYLDMVMDSYREQGLRPFLELGFMPRKMASGDQTIFYWRGNVTPPAEYERWTKMVQALLNHLMERYGEEDVVNWPIEVWNEPNLPGFWKGADMEEYFKLFKVTFYAIKEINPKFRVGGPAICGVDDERWMKCFMEFCSKEKIPLDFVTRHHYTTDNPEFDGHYGYPALRDGEQEFGVLIKSREIIDSFPEFKGMEMHITEFNTSYIGNAPLHDTNQNAAYVAFLLSRMGDINESYSYWTFGDIFEEGGVPFAPFHGGFGLVANGLIPKPTFWTFKFFKDLKDVQDKGGECVYKDHNAVIVRTSDGQGYKGIIWNDSRTRTGGELEFELELPIVSEERVDASEFFMIKELVDEEVCNPLKVWHDMGEPRSLTGTQRDTLRASSYPFLSSEIVNANNTDTEAESGNRGALKLNINLKEHGVCSFELKRRHETSDRGYDYNRTMQY